uniref:Thioredoxin domain-containing protein n=1 Tax=Oryza glumipatula TaxID=40148 RepID=A0A0E0A9S8_9ORYZ
MSSFPPLSFLLVRRRSPEASAASTWAAAEVSGRRSGGYLPASKALRRRAGGIARQRPTPADQVGREAPPSVPAPVSTRAASPVSCCCYLCCRILAGERPSASVDVWDGGRYYTGYPKDLGPSRIIPFTSERQFMQLLHEGRPVVVAFTIKCTYTQHLDKVLEEAAATFHPHVKFVRVECPKYPGFCLTRQKNEYPFIEVFYNPEQAASPGKVVDPNVTKYSVKVLPFNYDQSMYGFREYFKKHGFKYFETN